MSILLNINKIEDINAIYLEINSLPSPNEIKKVSNDIKTIVMTEKKYVLYANHGSKSKIDFPSFEHFEVITEILKESKIMIVSQLLGTVIQVQKLDSVTNLAKEIFLLVYKPIKPFAITQSYEETVEFLKRL